MEEEKNEDTQSRKAPHPGIVLMLVLVGYLSLIYIFVGRNDYISLLLVAVSAALIFQLTYDMRIAMRNFLADLFTEGTPVNEFLSKKKSAWHFGLAIYFSVSVALGFAFVFKSLTLVYPAFLIIGFYMASCLVCGLFSRSALEETEISSTVQNPENAKKFGEIISIVKYIFMVNVFMVILISGYGASQMIISEVNFANFHEAASSIAVDSAKNTYSRSIVNTGLVVDTFMQAAVNELITIFGITTEASKFFTFLFVVSFFNFFKILPASIAIVVIYFVMKDHYLKSSVRAYAFFQERLSFFGGRVKNKINARRDAKTTDNEG